jgi:uncharacterized protein YcfL
MIKLILVFFSLHLLVACQSEATNKPLNLIEEEKMSLILEEVLLIESHYQSKHGVPGIYKDALDKSLVVIFKKHQVTKKEFKDSYEFYASQPELFKALNTSIMDRLSRQIP